MKAETFLYTVWYCIAAAKGCEAKIFFTAIWNFSGLVYLSKEFLFTIDEVFKEARVFYAAQAARAALACRKINSLPAFSHLLSRLLFAVAHNSFENSLRSVDLRMWVPRILFDARGMIITGFYRYDCRTNVVLQPAVYVRAISGVTT